ncbi:TonB-dependent receptor [Flavisolibacter sp. BT320]|nr:TonB-dependent receptor [Flavisolibacter longurius]
MTPKTACLLLLAFFLLPFFAGAQQAVRGKVVNTRNEPLHNATVVLLGAADSSMVKGTFADKEGGYSFEKISPGTYFISVSMVGHDTAWTAPFRLQQQASLNLPLVVLKEGTVLDEVVLRSRKPLFQLKQDRVVMNVSASPAFSGNTGLELLEKTPGVIVDRQSNSITMHAKGEVLLMINNKIQRVPMSAVVARLEAMRAENIEQIEIIQQPPAKYDASGAAGIIHIVLKENNEEGSHASLSLIAGYGQREKAGLNGNLNSRKGKINLYGGYNFNLASSDRYTVNHFREYDYMGDTYYHENFVVLSGFGNRSHAGNIGLDVDFSPRTVMGIVINATKSKQVWGKGAESNSSDYINNVPAGSQRFTLSPTNAINSVSANLNLLQKISAKKTLNGNLDYARIRYDNATDLQMEYSSAAIANRTSLLDFWIAGLDYTSELDHEVKMEIGLKGSFNKTTSTTTSRNFSIAPDLFSGVDKISERILAGYVSLYKKFSKSLDGELGLRYEHYTYDLNSEKGEDIAKAFKTPFPIIRLTYAIDSIRSLQFAFNRAISRPPFFNLTSFLIILDSSLVVYANPRLRPAFTNTFKLSYGQKAFIFSLAYLRRRGQVYFLNTVDKAKHLQTSVPTNLDLENIWEANLSFSASPAGWWKTVWNLTGVYHRVKDASSHPVPFRNSLYTLFVQLNNSFRLGRGWTASLDGRYQSWLLVGDQEQLRYPSLNAGIRKEFAGGNTLGIMGQDLANAMGKGVWGYHQAALGMRTFGNNNWSERQVRVTYTHLFGNTKLSARRERKTGAEEVKSRM